MNEMKLIMENWRSFRLSEEDDGPKFKENPRDAVDLLGKILRLDPGKKEAVAEKIASDEDIAPILSALEELFKELESEPEKEPIEEDSNLEADLGSEIWGALGSAANKVTEFLESSVAGRMLKGVSGPVLGIALLTLFAQQPDGGASLQKSSATITKLMTSSDPMNMLAGSAEGLVDIMTESLQERKKR
jgi:hypothetical protein